MESHPTIPLPIQSISIHGLQLPKPFSCLASASEVQAASTGISVTDYSVPALPKAHNAALYPMIQSSNTLLPETQMLFLSLFLSGSTIKALNFAGGKCP